MGQKHDDRKKKKEKKTNQNEKRNEKKANWVTKGKERKYSNKKNLDDMCQNEIPLVWDLVLKTVATFASLSTFARFQWFPNLCI